MAAWWLTFSIGNTSKSIGSSTWNLRFSPHWSSEHHLPNLCVTCCFKLLVFGELSVLDIDTTQTATMHILSAPSRSDKVFFTKTWKPLCEAKSALGLGGKPDTGQNFGKRGSFRARTRKETQRVQLHTIFLIDLFTLVGVFTTWFLFCVFFGVWIWVIVRRL